VFTIRLAVAAIKGLWANKMRSFLSMLGIIIGVGAVITMLAIGTGAQRQIIERMTAMGTNLLIARPGQFQRGGVMSSAGRQSLKVGDAVAAVEIEGVDAVSPVVMGRAQIKRYNKNVNSSVTGTSHTYFEIRNFEVGSGRRFTVAEEDSNARVAVLGANTAKELFDKIEPIGEEIRVKNLNFRVIGVLKAKGDQGWFNPDDMVVIPYTTAMKQLLGQDYLSEIDVKCADGADTEKVEAGLNALLRDRHRIKNPADDDFNVGNQAEMIATASSFAQTFTILLGGIAGISLLVGGIGIMNIMLVSVTERTREIGVRKAIGAKDGDILRQFLFEALLLSGLGGFIGIASGYLGAQIASKLSELKAAVSPESVLLAFGVSAAVGVFFGYYPAVRAAKLDPIEALRYE
jgi:putative ABC transport system permease protein